MESQRQEIRVLLVEDDPADGAFVRQCLLTHTTSPLEFRQVTRLSEALADLRTRAFDLIITDLNLPDSEGLQTFLDLKAASPETAFVVVTGMDRREDGQRALSAGAQDYLVKGDPEAHRTWQAVHNAMVRHGLFHRARDSAKALQVANQRLATQARMDPLTGLYNRRGFDERLGRQAGGVGCVLLIDIDDFKQVNDRRGHDQGDLALAEVAQRLRARLRPGDFAARVGGDEFMVLLPETGLDAAVEVAERIRQVVDERLVPSADGPFHVTVSVGVVPQEKSHGSAHELLARTHQALSLSKLGGKNRVSMDKDCVVGPLDGGPRVLKRPFYRIVDGSVAGYEYLYRTWARPQPVWTGPGAPPPPVLRGFYHCVSAAAQVDPGVECHVRLGQADLAGLEPEDLLRLLLPGLQAAKLRLELRDLAHEALRPELLPLLRGLAGRGVRVALHDASLRQQPLAVLLQLEPDWVKLSRSWLHGGAREAGADQALERLVRSVDGLGARVMAGGIEAGDDLARLRRLGIFHGQGPLWSLHP